MTSFLGPRRDQLEIHLKEKSQFISTTLSQSDGLFSSEAHHHLKVVLPSAESSRKRRQAAKEAVFKLNASEVTCNELAPSSFPVWRTASTIMALGPQTP